MATHQTRAAPYGSVRAGRRAVNRRLNPAIPIVLALILLAVAAGIGLASHGWPWSVAAATPGDGSPSPGPGPTTPTDTQPPTSPPAIQPPSTPEPTAGKTIAVAIDRQTSAATVSLYHRDKLVATYSGYGGAPESQSPVGEYKVTARLGTIHTTLYESELGHDFYLKTFVQFKGNYGFHAFKVNDQTMEPEPGPTHGCIALPEDDAADLYEWAEVGIAVESAYK